MTGRNWLAAAGLVYVAAWIVGLAISMMIPTPDTSGAVLRTFYEMYRQEQLIQTYLIDGVAAVALLAFVAALRERLLASDAPESLADVIFGAAIAAASVSLVQAAIGSALASNPVLTDGDLPTFTALLALLNTADTFKLLALALLTGTTTVVIFRWHAMPRWIGWIGAILSLMLLIGGLSFVLDSEALYLVLYVALPLLLLWVGSMSVALLTRYRQMAQISPIIEH